MDMTTRSGSRATFMALSACLVLVLAALVLALSPAKALAHEADAAGIAAPATSAQADDEALVPGTITEATEEAEDGPTLQVFAGSNRYDTARLVVAQELAESGPFTGVIVVSGGEDRFADALSAAGLSGMLDYPLVVVNGAGLTDENKAALDALLAESAIKKLDILIVGGEAAVSKEVAEELEEWGTVSKRIAGSSRYETNKAVFDYGAERGEWSTDYAFLATGDNFPDALAIAPYLAWKKAPIALAPKGSTALSATAKPIMEKAAEVIALGGTDAVTDKLLTAAKDASKGKASSRLYGANRYATAVSIVKWELANEMTVEDAGLATGANFPDALASGFLLGKSGAVLALVSPEMAENARVSALIAGAASPASLRVFGGENAVSPTVHNQVASAAGWAKYTSEDLGKGASEETTVSEIVYVTKSGEKYHRASCPSTSGHEVTPLALADAKEKGYTPCKNCKPGE